MTHKGHGLRPADGRREIRIHHGGHRSAQRTRRGLRPAISDQLSAVSKLVRGKISKTNNIIQHFFTRNQEEGVGRYIFTAETSRWLNVIKGKRDKLRTRRTTGKIEPPGTQRHTKDGTVIIVAPDRVRAGAATGPMAMEVLSDSGGPRNRVIRPRGIRSGMSQAGGCGGPMLLKRAGGVRVVGTAVVMGVLFSIN